MTENLPVRSDMFQTYILERLA